jgi:hypothetical protein
MTPEECIELIRQLPDTRIQANGLQAENSYRKDDPSLIVATARYQYNAIADWLRYYWLGQNQLVENLIGSWKLDYKPHSDRVDSIWKLAKQVNLKEAWMREQSIDPQQLTYSCVSQICESELINAGYLGKASSIGKRENYINATKYYEQLEATNRVVSVREAWLPPMQALEQSATFVASYDVTFRNTSYRDYLREQKRFHRLTAKGGLNIIRLSDRGIEIGGKGKGKALGQNKRLCKGM